ncbi:MAG: hybrid sensor histidine kinase/response regulator [Fibrobacterales bacterium]
MNGTDPVRILVVDDNTAIHEDFRSILSDSENDSTAQNLKKYEDALFAKPAEKPVIQTTYTNYRIDHAYNAQEAINMVHVSEKESDPYALIFMDVRMPPGMDGIQAIQNIWDDYPEIEMVICTAHSDYNWDQIIEKLGLTDHLLILKKPFDSVAVKQFALTQSTKWKLQKSNKLYTASLEEKVVERTSELQFSLDQLKSAQTQLIQSEKMASLGELVAGVAHEINTPIGVGITAASFIDDNTHELKKRYEDKKISNQFMQEYINTVTTSSKMLMTNLNRAAELIAGFKQVAVDQTTDLKRTFKISELIHNVTFSLNPRLKQAGVTININCDEDLSFNSYPGSFSQVMTNMIMNSIIHGFEEQLNGVIDVTVTTDTQLVTILYQDNGRGIGPDQIKKVFDPFYTTKRGQGGTGLGMHIIYNIISQNFKGNIVCESEQSSYTRFTITIPFSQLQ